METILREFIYFDREKIEDFLSIIEDGLVKEETEIQRNHGTKIKAEGGFKPIANIGGEKGYQDNELQKLKNSTDASLFQRLYNHLTEKKMIKKVRSIDNKSWNQIKVGELLELDANIEFSALSLLIEKIVNLMEFMEMVGPENVDDKTKEAMLGFKMLSHLSSKEGLNIKITLTGNSRYKFVAILSPENIKGTKQELIGKYKVMCRVQKIIRKNEKFELFKLIPGLELNKKMITDFLKIFDNLPPMFGKPPKIEDLQVSYPAMIITPIAVYR
ncbi:DUF6414 family protein [Methanobacterium formicicum]|uniref:DUF6414 family protein n=1 Tax=Methanobacterium formicicum TaxID=2162 RepID=UPI002412A269|nr:hypothetical protein [Methanobacterium formicicum]MDG3547649.1 hypothetical protein [Methanobacterium formicicum]